MACCTVACARGDPPQDSRRRLDKSVLLAIGLLTMSVTIVDARLVTVILSSSATSLHSSQDQDANWLYHGPSLAADEFAVG